MGKQDMQMIAKYFRDMSVRASVLCKQCKVDSSASPRSAEYHCGQADTFKFCAEEIEARLDEMKIK